MRPLKSSKVAGLYATLPMLVGMSVMLAILGACSDPGQPRSNDGLQAEVDEPREAAMATATAAPSSQYPEPKPTPTVTATPTTIPSPTPWPEVRVAVPEYLTGNVQNAIEQLTTGRDTWRWRIMDQGESADVRLVPGPESLPAGQRAIALTVPFSTDWEAVSLAEAEEIVANGHDLVAIMDWAEMPPWRKALRVEGLLPAEPDYPIKQEWSLDAAPGYESAAQELGQVLSDIVHYDPVVHLAAVGDLMLDRALGYAILNGDIYFPFEEVADELKRADLTVGNLESALGDVGQPAAKSYTFRAPPAAADSVAAAGIDVLTLANNHAMDYGPEALIQALELLSAREIATVGAGNNEESARSPFVVELGGLTFAILGYVDVPVEVSGFDTRLWSATEESPGLAWAEPEHIAEDVSAADKIADIVVVLLHSGFEYLQPPSPAQQHAAQTAVDAGADLVVGHHAHVLQGVEFRDNAVIAYGLGNFAFEIDGDPSTAILNAWLDGHGVRQLEFVPAIIQAGGQPRLAAPWEAWQIRQQVYYLTGQLNGAR